MNADIIAVGSEMLTPVKVDTNSLFLTQELNTLGIEVVAKAVIGDDRARLTSAIRSSLEHSEIVILTGGLGPTEDDVTRDAAAAALGIGQQPNEEVWQAILSRFKRFGRTPTGNNRRQTMILDGAEIMPNGNGTAPGQWLRNGRNILILLPGPPRELTPMVKEQVIPRLTALLPPLVIRTRWYRVAMMPESELDALIAPIYMKYTNPVTTILAAAGDIHIHLRARCETEEEANRLLAEVGDPIAALLGDRIYSNDGSTLDQTVGMLLRRRSASVAVAESCTGGMLSETFTASSGASEYFSGGFVAYTGDIKSRLLGVPPELLAEYSAVSEPVAAAMADGARERTGSTYSLSITGYADGEHAGLVFIGLASPEDTKVRKLQFTGDRERVRQMTTIAALDWLRRTLSA
jgi:nicotinamide-nucleotide amidase